MKSASKDELIKKFEYDEDENSDEEDNLNFFKDKHESDQNYLSKLNQINLNSELKIENTDFNLFKNRRNVSSRNHDGSFLHSASQNSINSDRGSKMSNRSQIRTTPIPPADKNMEVIVGKGRRSATNSARSTASTSKTSLPPNGRKANLKNKGALTCENCNKQYENIKDMEIHKMYCV